MKANTASGIRFAFVESLDKGESPTSHTQLGHYLEIYDDHPDLRAFYSRVKEASVDWDGQDPLRTFG